jgi:hypothetical protein
MFSGIGTPRHPLFFLGFKGPRRKLFKCKLGCKLGSCLHKKKSTSDPKDHVVRIQPQQAVHLSASMHGGTTVHVDVDASSATLSHMRIPLLPPPLQIELEMDDVAQERERVEQLLARGETAPIIIRDLRKTFPSQDGNK